MTTSERATRRVRIPPEVLMVFDASRGVRINVAERLQIADACSACDESLKNVASAVDTMMSDGSRSAHAHSLRNFEDTLLQQAAYGKVVLAAVSRAHMRTRDARNVVRRLRESVRRIDDYVADVLRPTTRAHGMRDDTSSGGDDMSDAAAAAAMQTDSDGDSARYEDPLSSTSVVQVFSD